MDALHLWTSHRHPVPLPEGHPFPAGKYAPLELAAAGVTLGGTYPAPVVDHAEQRDSALAMYAAVAKKP